jgi:V-type H+-transporting ATPase proteolipid subunit
MIMFAIFAIILAIALTGLGSGFATRRAAVAAEKAMKENPQLPSIYTLIFTVFPTTPLIYGFLIGIIEFLALNKVDLLSSYAFLAASISGGIGGFLAALGIGIVSEASLAALSKQKTLFAKSLIYMVFPESTAIYALLLSILILFATNVSGISKIKTMDQVIACFSIIIASIVIGVVGYFLGQIGKSGIKTLLTQEKSFIYSLLILAIPETIAIFSLLTGIMILKNVGLF